MANTYLTRSTTSGTDTVWTWSGWLKRSKLGSSQTFFGTGNGSSSANSLQIRFSDDDTLDYRNFVSSSYNGRLSGGRKFRDNSAWYHFVFVWDTTQASGGNRMKAYCNGETITGFTDIQDPGLNSSAHTSGSTTFIGTDGYGGSTYFDGSLSHIHFIDGTAYDATAFGETDATTGEWVGKTSPSVTYGTNGFFILKDGNGITDQSGEGNDFTLGGGTLTDLKDNPDNVFATWNPLDNFYPAMTLSEGNTKALTTVPDKYTYIPTTLGMTSGKYYAEIKVTAQSGSENEFLIGITSTSTGVGTAELGNYANDYGYFGLTGQSRNNDTLSSYGSTYTVGDIIGIAVDLDNNKLYFRKNNDAWNNSGDPTSGSTGTGAISITDPTLTSRGAYFFAVCNFSATTTATFDANFGNGYFGTTAITTNSGNGYAGAEGSSKFNYTVPTGYSALNTKGLNE